MSIYYGLALFSPPRSIGDIVANVTLLEEGADTYTITEHPVEVSSGGINGAISDHMYRNPAVLVIKAGWSNSRPESLLNIIPTFTNSYVSDVYDKLRSLQSSRVPFSVTTGKRDYQNMVMRSLVVTTDEHSENALMVTMICQEVLTATTKTVTVPDASQSKIPQSTQDATDQGNLQLAAGDNFAGMGGHL